MPWLSKANFISENIISAPIPQSEISSIFRENASTFSPSIDILKNDTEILLENLDEEEERQLKETLLKYKGAELYRKLGFYIVNKFNVIRYGSNLYFYNNGI